MSEPTSDGRVTCRTTFWSYFPLIIFANFWVKNVSDVWVWTHVNKLWEMNYMMSWPSPANAWRKVHKAIRHKASLETRHTYCDHEWEFYFQFLCQVWTNSAQCAFTKHFEYFSPANARLTLWHHPLRRPPIPSYADQIFPKVLETLFAH